MITGWAKAGRSWWCAAAWFGLVALAAMGCGQSERPVRHLVLPSGDSVPILLLVRRDFPDGSPSALQLVYRTATAGGDTMALRAEAREVWSVFGGVVEQQGLHAAVLTADVPGPRAGVQGAGVWTGVHQGFVVRQGADGGWRFTGDTAALAPPGALPSEAPRGASVQPPR